MELNDVVWVDSERMGGTPCFRGTRVPVKTLFDYLMDGYTLGEFLSHFPTVPRELAEAYLKLPLDEADRLRVTVA